MQKYKIPTAFISGFELISKLDIKTIESASNIIQKSKFGATPKQLSEKIAREVKDLNDSEAQNMLTTLFSLINLKDEADNSDDEFVEDVVNSYAVQREDMLEENRTNLTTNLIRLFKIGNTISSTIKAHRLLSEHEKILVGSRILTDVRMIFDEDINNNIKYATVVHKLRLSYVENDETKNIFFALDINDLKHIRNSVDRAIDKEKLIVNNKFHEKGLSFLKLEND